MEKESVLKDATIAISDNDIKNLKPANLTDIKQESFIDLLKNQASFKKVSNEPTKPEAPPLITLTL